MTVRAGTSYQGDDGAVVSVSRLIIHPSFDLQESYDYDVAILQLSDSFEIGPNIQTIGNEKIKLLFFGIFEFNRNLLLFFRSIYK